MEDLLTFLPCQVLWHGVTISGALGSEVLFPDPWPPWPQGSLLPKDNGNAHKQEDQVPVQEGTCSFLVECLATPPELYILQNLWRGVDAYR